MAVTTTSLEPGRIPQWNITDRLRKAREDAGFDQVDLAELIGVGRSSISNYEKGVSAPKRPVILSWAIATGVDLEWLWTGLASSESDPTDPSVQVSRTSPCMTDDAEIIPFPQVSSYFGEMQEAV